MDYAAIGNAFEVTVWLSTAAALGIGAVGWAKAGAEAEARASASARARARGGVATVLLHPLAQFVIVCLVIYVNQVLFGAYVLRAHHGSTAFIARFIPGAWFAIGTQDPLVGFAARHVGDAAWLSPTVLRVQAFLELPFTMLAYLAVARLLGRRLFATLCKPVILALVALSFSVTFSLVELMLPNPYTNDDLVLRGIACLIVPVYIAWIARVEARRAPAPTANEDGPSGVLGLLAFLAGAAAIAYVVLALYDAFLLYNLAHLPRYASGIAVSLVVAAVASFAAPRVDAALAKVIGTAAAPSPAMDVCVSGLRFFTILFAVPSLALRYWGGHPSAVLCGLLVVGLAAVAGLTAAVRRARLGPADVVRLLLALSAAVFAGGWAGHLAFTVTTSRVMPELVLARVALSFLAVAILIFRATEFALVWTQHETKAPADEA